MELFYIVTVVVTKLHGFVKPRGIVHCKGSNLLYVNYISIFFLIKNKMSSREPGENEKGHSTQKDPAVQKLGESAACRRKGKFRTGIDRRSEG